MASCSKPLRNRRPVVSSSESLPCRVVRLADHADHLPELQRWFAQEWADYYGPDGPGDAAADLQAYCRRDGLPLRTLMRLRLGR